ncbi:hypothetical protein BZG36_01922 [Bifiguratus adelaidae]|uniref:Coiled-coil domain-containing protein 130 n=1 Tax=Bifiguratus adelaidae TaxID=1938954 RepID=A0A261Y4G6_9FUNG|nr:hypothetical protein BZG36_01922 [Bifiguratus adelaidae]
MQPFNKYYPPDWTPDKGSVNKFVGKHPLGDRARKIKQGILVVRFELPFNIWCDGCDNHIGVGVRYNAEKKKIGNYHSTPIWQFRMKCHLCSQWIEIHTDPKNARYVVVSGARQKVEDYEPEDAEVIRLKDEAMAERMANDAFYALEHQITDTAKAKESVPALTQLQTLNDKQWADPYVHSARLRKKFREEKKAAKKEQDKANEIRDRNALHIELLPEAPEDVWKAKLVDFGGSSQQNQYEERLKAATSSMFASPTSGKDHGSSARHLSTVVKAHTMQKLDPFLKTSDWRLPAKPTVKSNEAKAKVKIKEGPSQKAPALVSDDYGSD